jgi:hypothetical protein
VQINFWNEFSQKELLATDESPTKYLEHSIRAEKEISSGEIGDQIQIKSTIWGTSGRIY